MYGGFEPPEPSREEMRQAEAAASFTVQQFLATSILLYLSPFAVDAIWKVF